jgi:uncharacterized membrane protein
MEELIVAILCIAVIALAIKLNRLVDAKEALSELRDLTWRLEQRLANLERQVARQAANPPDTLPVEAAPPPAQAAHIEPRVATPQYVVPAPVRQAASPEPVRPIATVPPPPPVPPAPLQPGPLLSVEPPSTWQPTPGAQAKWISIEERLGQNWLNKIGIVLLVLGVASFLGYKLVTFGPLGKSLTGLILSLVILIGGLFLERKPNYRVFARACIGGGWALLFFVTFALYHVDAMRILPSQGIDLVLMLLVAAGMVWHSLRYKSQVVTSLAFLLAFATVGISHVTLFSLVAGALLTAGLIYVVAREYWFELGLAGLVGVYFNHFLWLTRVLPDGGQLGHPFPDFLASAGLILLYWFLFRLLYVLRVPLTRRQELISSITAILNSIGLLGLLKYQSSHPEWAFAALLALGTVEFLLAFLARTRWQTAFTVLSTLASGIFLAAIPFRFSGSNWTLLWLLEAEVLFVAGIRIRESVFRRLGLIAGFIAGLQVLITDAAPIFQYRQSHLDLTHHASIAIAVVSAALVFWFNSEFARRRWSDFFAEPFDEAALRVTSYLAAFSLAIGLWVFFPGSWTIVAWLVATLAISFAADRLPSVDLATQADILAAAAVLRALIVNLGDDSRWGSISVRAITVTIASTLLYAGMRRRTRGEHLPQSDYIPVAYSWAASALLGTLVWYELQPVSIAVAWGVLGLVLFELGVVLRREYLRHQAYVLFAPSFIRIFFVNLNIGDTTHVATPRIYTVLPLIAAYIWVYQRAQGQPSESRIDRIAGGGAAWFGTIAASAILYFELRPELVTLGWSALALVLILAAWLLRRPIFTAQAITLLVASAARAVLFNLFSPTPLATSFWTSRVFTVSLSSAAMLLCLPMAFQIRRERLAAQPSGHTSEGWDLVLSHPEQPFFFVPLLLAALLVAFELRTGIITVGWIALGLVAFLFALPVGERSYRLAGLGLLLLGIGKIVLVDIWSATPTDRYLTLIITGVALLLVSFLYSRYRETILKFL